jgi:hypothetical protein
MTTILTPEAIAGMAQHRSPEFIAAYITLKKTNFECAVSGLPWEMPVGSERSKLLSIRQKNRHKGREEAQAEFADIRKKAMRAFFMIAKQTNKIAKFRSCYKLQSHWDEYASGLTTRDMRDLAALKNYTSFCIAIGSRMKSVLTYDPPFRLKQKEEKPLHLEYPLYSCSGELEADRMDTNKLYKLSRGLGNSHGNHYMWRHSKHLNFDRDGGGQAEVQFHIRPELTSLVCKLVKDIGRLNRNGGHIHLNCQKDEEIGKRVFNSLRYHLSWTRWLVPYTRRDHNWSSVASTGSTFDEARRIKASAISCNTWSRTGTVEMRLWGTSNKQEEWLGRKDLMQSIAKWSEGHDPIEFGVKPISQETATAAWPSFFTWASRNAPAGLAYALKTFRKKIRSSATAQLDRNAAIGFMRSWEESGLTCRGYRCRTRCTTSII